MFSVTASDGSLKQGPKRKASMIVLEGFRKMLT